MTKKFWVLICLALLIIGATLFLNWYLLQDIKVENRGVYGDLFGFANTLFSGLAFVGVIAAILIQSEELKLQRNELKETRAEFEQQNATLKKQSFENIFFKLLELKNQSLDYLKTNQYQSGERYLTSEMFTSRDQLKELFDRKDLDDLTIDEITSLLSGYTINDDLKYLSILLNTYIKSYENLIIFLFSTELIIKSEKSTYESILANQLSEAEFYFLYIFDKLGYYPIFRNPESHVLNKLFDNVSHRILIERV